MEKYLYFALTLTGAILQFAACWWCFSLNSEKCPAAEKIPRNRLAGMIIGIAALLICVPHVQVICPGFLLPFLYPLAVAIPVLSYFFLDHCLARAIGGAMILWAYYWINVSFVRHSPLMWVIAFAAWLWGALGIWISGKPWAIRDWIRKCSTNKKWKYSSCTILAVFGIITLLSALMEVL